MLDTEHNTDARHAAHADRRKEQMTPADRQAAYHLARLRTQATGVKHHVDHIIPLQSDVVCGLHVENNLRVIPATMNIRKSNALLHTDSRAVPYGF